MTYTRTDRGEAGAATLIIGGIVLLVLVVVGSFGLQWITAGPRGQLSQREKTVANGDYRIANYDHFYDLCGSIQAMEDQIHNTQARPADAGSGFSKQQKQAILLAQRNQRATLVRQYNADSSKAGTAAQFKASDLPFNININEENTQCAR